MYRCASCGGRFAITANALAAIGQGRWNPAELAVPIRRLIAVGELPRIEEADGKPSVIAVGRQVL
jgi:hypothetical protein